MADEYNFANKYKLTEEISNEPFGKYYFGQTADQKKFLILLLSSEASALARPHLPKLQDKLQDKILLEDNKVTDALWPVLEIVDLLTLQVDTCNSEDVEVAVEVQEQVIKPAIRSQLSELQEPTADSSTAEHINDYTDNIMIIMPYIEGRSLASSINNFKKPLTLRKTLRLLSPLCKRITSEHKNGKFHGFINFSTVWLTNDNKLKLIGFDLFNIIFEKLEVKASELYHPKISSCLSEDNQIAKITFSIASDYYAILIIVCSLLQGSIPTSKNYIFTPLQNVNKKARKFLTANYYREAYQQNLTLDQWLAQLQSTIKWPVLENIIAVVLVVGLLTVVTYQNREQIKTSVLASYYDSFRKNYISLVHYFYDNTSSNKIAAASGSIDKGSTSISSSSESVPANTIESKDIKDSKVASVVSNLDVENNLLNYTPNQDKNANTTVAKTPSDAPGDVAQALATADQKPANKATITSTASTEGWNCAGTVCREPIVDSITGPKMIKSALFNDQFWLMQSPLSRRDYYTFCYFVEDCKQKKDIVSNKVLKCLFENSCSDDTELWLNYPITGLDTHDLNKYLSWLNKVTNGGYEVLPDKYWPLIASKFRPDQNCIFVFNGSNDFIASNKPELVTVNNKLAVRTAAKMIPGEGSFGEAQCQTLLTDHVSSNDKNTVIRLAKRLA